MEVDQQRFGTIDVLAPDGPITEEDFTEVVSAISSRLTSCNPRLVLCMKDVPYMDSCGLELLLDAAAQLRAHSMQLKLAALTPTCREILDLTELTGEFELFDDVEDAVRSFL